MRIGPQPRLRVAAGAAVDGHPRARPAHELQPHLRRGQRIHRGPSDADWRQAVRAHRPAQHGKNAPLGSVQARPGRPPRPGRLWAVLRSQARRPAHVGAPSSASGAQASRLRDADLHAFWPSRPAAGKSAARGARMQRLLDQSAVACRARGAAFFWLIAGFARGPGGSLPRKGLARSPGAAPLLLSGQSPVVRLRHLRRPARAENMKGAR